MKIVPYLLIFALFLTNCVHVSSSSMTALGTDAEEVTYNTGGSTGPEGKPTVAFNMKKMNNSNSFGRVMDLGGSLITWWGIGQIARAAGNAYNNYNHEETVKTANQLKAGVATKAIESKTAIELGKQALVAP